MTNKDIVRIIRERTNPSVFDCAYIATRAHLKAFRQFAALLSERTKKSGAPCAVLDIGCGYKPFRTALASAVRIGEHTGVDFDRSRSYADIAAWADELPLPDNHFDAVLATEVLEHTRDPRAVVREIKRVAKDRAFIYISTPFVFPEHGIPHDFARFTRYAFYDLFAHDAVLLCAPTNASLATVLYACNICWKSMTVLERIPVLTHLFYAMNNIVGCIAEWLVRLFGFLGRSMFWRRRAWFNECFENYFYRMPAGYDVIVQIKKT